MMIKSGKWFVHKSKVYVVIKCFEVNEILRLSKSTSPDVVIAYMINQGIIRQQVSLDFRLSGLFNFLSFEENEK